MAELNENELIGSFVDFYNKKAEETKFQMGFNFNVLAEQCGNIVENSHTNMLMRLLEYRNKYISRESLLLRVSQERIMGGLMGSFTKRIILLLL